MLTCPHVLLTGIAILEAWWPGLRVLPVSLFLRFPLRLAEGISTWVILLGPWARPALMGTLVFSLAEAFRASQDLPTGCLQAGGATCLMCHHAQTLQYFALRGFDLPPPYSATGGKEEEKILRTHLLPSLSLYQLSSAFPPDLRRGSPLSKEVKKTLT